MSLVDINIVDLSALGVITNNELALAFLRRHGLIATSMLCSSCEVQMVEKKNARKLDGVAWRCQVSILLIQ